MKCKTWSLAIVALFFCNWALCAEPANNRDAAAERELKKVDAMIKRAPNNPMHHYRRAQCLMKLGEYDRGCQSARDAMQRFVAQKSTLTWMLLEEIDLGTVRVQVRLNMGPNERRPPAAFGIVRPVSFIVHKGGSQEVIDYEIGYIGGKPSTAALGQTTAGAHANFGMVKLDAKYEAVRKQALDLIKDRHNPQPLKQPARKR